MAFRSCIQFEIEIEIEFDIAVDVRSLRDDG
jgi:hypothetical protein